jgi:hypothetical protein
MRPGQKEKEQYFEVKLRISKNAKEPFMECRPTGAFSTYEEGRKYNHRVVSGTLYYCEKHGCHVCEKHWKKHEDDHIMEALSK